MDCGDNIDQKVREKSLMEKQFQTEIINRKCSSSLDELTKYERTDICGEGREFDQQEASDTDSEDETCNYGDGVDSVTFEAIKHIILDSILATRKMKSRSNDAEGYLSALLGICTKEQRKELMKVKDDYHHDHVPLSLACKMGNLEVVRFLVEYCEADVEGYESNGRPLLWAVANQNEDIVRYLLEHNADAGKNIGANFNLLMFSMKIFTQPPFQTFGYGVDGYDDDDEDSSEDEEEKEKDKDENKHGGDEHEIKVDENSNEIKYDENVNEVKPKGKLEDKQPRDDMDKEKHKDDQDEEKEEDRRDEKPEEKNKECEQIPVPFLPKLKIVKMLIDKGAVEKCSDVQLFDIFTTMTTLENRDVINLGAPEDLYKAVLPLLLRRVPNLANIRNAQGISLLGYEMLHKEVLTKCPVSNYMKKYFKKGNGTDINSANVLKNYTIPKSDKQQETIETNVDTILKYCTIDSTTNEVILSEDTTVEYQYIHPVVYLACAGKRLISACLNKSQIPFQAKFDALEASGAYFAAREYFKDAMNCWEVADLMKEEKFNQNGNGGKYPVISHWEKDVICKDMNRVAVNLLNPMEGMPHVHMDLVYADMSETALGVAIQVTASHEKWVKCGSVPKLSVSPPETSFKFHLNNLCHQKETAKLEAESKSDGKTVKTGDKESAAGDKQFESQDKISVTDRKASDTKDDKSGTNVEDEVTDDDEEDEEDEEWETDEDDEDDDDEVSTTSEEERDTRIALLLKSGLIHERLMGYGSFETLKSIQALANEYESEDFIQEWVTLVVYSFPYFIKHISQEERFMMRDILKTDTLKKFIKDLTNLFFTILVDEEYDMLSYDLMMAVFKCFFLNCLATPKKQRYFSDMAPLLLAIKVLSRYEKSEEEKCRFLGFMKRVIKDDLRNCYGQGLLHYASPVIPENSREGKIGEDLEDVVIGSEELVEILLSLGSDPNSVDDFGMTPLHMCYRVISVETSKLKSSRLDDRYAIINSLIKSGAHPDCLDARDKTPIFYSESSSTQMCPVGNRSLQCLASAVILDNCIPYKGRLPSDLFPFLDLHRKKGKSKSKSKFLQELKRPTPSRNYWVI
ncbi:uncharacterized protein [Mytilus edulis]|uniref:uncharacterized protein n=1 Tax=Mytilus edulis TaxID=6550 RepID=UPI0039EF99DA